MINLIKENYLDPAGFVTNFFDANTPLLLESSYDSNQEQQIRQALSNYVKELYTVIYVVPSLTLSGTANDTNDKLQVSTPKTDLVIVQIILDSGAQFV